jgi:prepilin-type N-terminal cleavage/methylation domain-containing protein/prepilin-type processing-associated H-X9-DG protein
VGENVAAHSCDQTQSERPTHPPAPSLKGRESAHGVTLIEILAVLAIIALLLGLLLPVLAHAAEAGRSARCRTNLRQLAVGAQLYAQTYKVYPPALRYENSAGVFRTIAWDYEHAGSDVKPGTLWQFLATDGGEVHQCPTYHGSSNFFTGDPHTGYNYNTSYIGGEAKFPSTGWSSVRWRVPVSAHRRMTTTVVFGEGGWKSGANKFMRAPSNAVEHNLWTIYAGGQAFRHHKSTNAAYLDGHVGSIAAPQPGPHATTALLETVMDYPRNGFLSEDDSAYDPR